MYVWHVNVILQLEICGVRVREKAVVSHHPWRYFERKEVKLYELALLCHSSEV